MGHVNGRRSAQFILVALALCGADHVQPVAAQQYAVTDLGAGVTPYAVNDVGQVVGTGANNHAFVWTPSVPNGTSGTMRDLGTGGGTASTARGAGNDGRVVGSLTATNPDGTVTYRAFVWDPATGMHDLNSVAGPDGNGPAAFGWVFEKAYNINDRGQIAGTGLWTDPATNLAYHGAIWVWQLDASGNVVVSLTRTGTNNTDVFGPADNDAIGLNNYGQVANKAHDDARNEEATLWTPDASGGSRAFLGFLAPGLRSEAHAINNPVFNSSGTLVAPARVVGYSSLSVYGGNPFHATVWDVGAGVRDLGTLGGTTSDAFGVNDAGTVVGWTSDKIGTYRAFVWDSTHGMRDLNTLIPSGLKWSLSYASTLNDRPSAQVIGRGVLNKVNHGFLLTPP